MKNLFKKYFTVLKIIWVLLIIIFVAHYLYKNYQQVLNIFTMLPVAHILLSFIFIVVSKVLLAGNMSYALRFSGAGLPFSKCFRIYNITQLAKYIPGGIWQYIGKAGIYNSEGMKAATIKKGIIVEVLWFLLGAFFTGICLIVVTKPLLMAEIVKTYQRHFLIGGIAGLVMAGILFIIYFQKIGNQAREFLSNLRLLGKVALLQALVWFFLGASFVMVVRPFTVDYSLFFYLIGLYALAYVIGFVIPFAPAGLGIREAVLVFGLSFFVTPEISVALAGIHRVIYILVEIGLVLIGQFEFFSKKFPEK
ncbi:MAG: lysylphosphatidylglycerol synthase domain-containing protein [Firmicutes bacterium]|nr:lysylphosphatidylglycerol synthase domain-containing protein [Bacillota bacterium]